MEGTKVLAALETPKMLKRKAKIVIFFLRSSNKL